MSLYFAVESNIFLVNNAKVILRQRSNKAIYDLTLQLFTCTQSHLESTTLYLIA